MSFPEHPDDWAVEARFRSNKKPLQDTSKETKDPVEEKSATCIKRGPGNHVTEGNLGMQVYGY